MASSLNSLILKGLGRTGVPESAKQLGSSSDTSYPWSTWVHRVVMRRVTHHRRMAHHPCPRHTMSNRSPSRRTFIQGSGMMLAGGAIVGTNLDVAKAAHAFGSDQIKIALVGCGSRGIGAMVQALATSGGGVQLVAMADVFHDSLHTAYRTIKSKHPQKVSNNVGRHVGLGGFRDLLQGEADLVFLATPPGFRPQQFEAAVEAGKHVFMEKPVATDAPGVRRVLEASRRAETQGLAVHVGLQRRHDPRYQQCLDRLRDGAIGEPIYARAHWNGGGMRVRPREPRQTELEYQLRNWYYFNWLSGDHIVEQHIHNLDVINWLLGQPPVECQGQGGREIRNEPDHGQIFDHHAVEFTYPGEVKLMSQCRQIAGCWKSVGEHVYGTAGHCDIGQGTIFDRHGNVSWRYQGPEHQGPGRHKSRKRRGDLGWHQQQSDLFAALRRGEAPNEGKSAAESTLTAIMGRMATYSGKPVSWDDAFHSRQRLAETDTLRSLDDPAPVLPDANGTYQVAIPGQTQAL